MSISNVTGVSGVARVVLPANANRPSEPAVDKPSETATRQASGTALPVPTELPAELRFPWLSRLARTLEPASPQPSPYGRVELLGERLDKQA